MVVWIITVGEPLPLGSGRERLFRSGILADTLAKRGHTVVWWSSAFDHFAKRHVAPTDSEIDVRKNLKLRLLHSSGYRSNLSLRRIADHIGLARKFARLCEAEEQPDVILCSMPTIELSAAATRYGRRRGVPVVLDVRDLWPDIFLDVAPPALRPLARAALAPLSCVLRRACRDATALSGMTPGIVDWALAKAGRERTALDVDFPFGYTDAAPSEEAIREAKRFWADRGVGERSQEFTACFFGTFGRQFELDVVIEAARDLSKADHGYRFVLCGGGDSLPRYRRLARSCPAIQFPGWVERPEIWTLMRFAAVGLAPYRSTKDFVLSLPNKSIEYLSAGLPIVTSLKGTLERLVTEHDCGLVYENGSAESLASALSGLRSSPARMSRMRANAAALFSSRFRAEVVYGEMADYLERLAFGA